MRFCRRVPSTSLPNPPNDAGERLWSASTAASRSAAIPSAGKVFFPNIGPAVTVSRVSKRTCSAGASFATNIPPTGHFVITSPSSTVRKKLSLMRRIR